MAKDLLTLISFLLISESKGQKSVLPDINILDLCSTVNSLIQSFSSDIKIAKGGKAMNCKAIFGVMGLAVKKGDEVTLTFDGADEDAAYEAVSKFMQENL